MQIITKFTFCLMTRLTEIHHLFKLKSVRVLL